MAVLDIILLVCFAPAIVAGISKGFVKQLVDIASILVGTWMAFRFARMVSEWLGAQISGIDPKLLYVISFAIILVAAVLILNLVGQMICRVIKIASLGWMNRLAGLVFGILKVALLLGLGIMIFEGLNAKWELVHPDTLKDAVVYNALKDFSGQVFPYLKNLVTGGPAANV